MSLTNKGNPLGIFGSKIQSVLAAVSRGNKRVNLGRGSFRVFPTNSGEAIHPQKVRRSKEK